MSCLAKIVPVVVVKDTIQFKDPSKYDVVFATKKLARKNIVNSIIVNSVEKLFSIS